MNEMENIRVETLTLEQTAQIFRNVGVSTTAQKIADALEQAYTLLASAFKVRASQDSLKFINAWFLNT